MFELFDQFLYLAILMFGAYITLYIKSRSYSGILLIAASILSNIFLFAIVLDPFIFITLPITAVLLLKDFFDDFKTGIVSRKHKLGALIAGAIIIYDVIFIIQISALHLGNSYSLFTVGSVIGTITGFYLVIYPFKEMMAEREANLQTLYTDDKIKLENNQKQLENKEANSSLIDVLDASPDATSSEDNRQRAQKTTEGKIFGVDSLYVVVGAVVILLLIGSIAYNFVTRTVIDMKDYVFVTVEPNSLNDAKVGYYASFENFDQNNFYDDLIEEATEYGLDEEQIAKYTPVYTSENATMFKKLDIKIANDKQTVNNGDVVTTNITYNEDYALKNNIVIKNSNFETEINSIPTLITDINQVDVDALKQLTKVLITGSDKAAKYNLDGIEPQFNYITEKGYISIIVSYTGEIKDGLFSNVQDTVSFLVTPYLKDDELYIPDQIQIVNIDKYQADEF